MLISFDAPTFSAGNLAHESGVYGGWLQPISIGR